MPFLGFAGTAGTRAFGSISRTIFTGGQQTFSTVGTFTWVAPAGVTAVSVFCVGGGGGAGSGESGGGGGGGGTAWMEDEGPQPRRRIWRGRAAAGGRGRSARGSGAELG